MDPWLNGLSCCPLPCFQWFHALSSSDIEYLILVYGKLIWERMLVCDLQNHMVPIPDPLTPHSQLEKAFRSSDFSWLPRRLSHTSWFETSMWVSLEPVQTFFLRACHVLSGAASSDARDSEAAAGANSLTCSETCTWFVLASSTVVGRFVTTRVAYYARRKYQWKDPGKTEEFYQVSR